MVLPKRISQLSLLFVCALTFSTVISFIPFLWTGFNNTCHLSHGQAGPELTPTIVQAERLNDVVHLCTVTDDGLDDAVQLVERAIANAKTGGSCESSNGRHGQFVEDQKQRLSLRDVQALPFAFEHPPGRAHKHCQLLTPPGYLTETAPELTPGVGLRLYKHVQVSG